MSKKQLKEIIHNEEFETLRCRLQAYFPDSVTVYNIVRQKMQGQIQDIRVYVPRDDIDVPISVIRQQCRHSYPSIMLFCPHDRNDTLLAILNDSDLFDWSHTFLFPFLPDALTPSVSLACKQHNFSFSEPATSAESCLCFWKPEPFKRHTSLPDGYRLGELRDEDYSTVLEEWSYKSAIALQRFEEMRSGESNVAVYFGEQDKLVGWVIEGNFGNIGQLAILREHRRKGLASVLIERICNKIQQDGNMASTFLRRKNEASINLFEKMQFKKAFEVQFLYCHRSQEDK